LHKWNQIQGFWLNNLSNRWRNPRFFKEILRMTKHPIRITLRGKIFSNKSSPQEKKSNAWRIIKIRLSEKRISIILVTKNNQDLNKN